MVLTLLELFKKQSEPDIRNRVKTACWRYAKDLLAKPVPSPSELKQASKLLSSATIEIYIIAVCVIIDDSVADDAAIEAAVATTANKLVALEI